MEGEAVRCYTGNVPMRHAFCTRARCGVRELRAGVDPLTLVPIDSAGRNRVFRNELGRARSALAANPLGV